MAAWKDARRMLEHSDARIQQRQNEMNNANCIAAQEEVKHDKPARGYEQRDFGLHVVYKSGTVSVINEALCQSPIDSAALTSARLYALTNLLTGNGWTAFDELMEQDQQCVLEVINDLAAQTAALTRLAETVHIDTIKTMRATAETSHV
jgi:hypothetical protein